MSAASRLAVVLAVSMLPMLTRAAGPATAPAAAPKRSPPSSATA